MKTKIYAVRDTRTEAYMRPFFVQNDAVMTRAITDAVEDPTQAFNAHPEDYAVYHLGEYDDNTGKMDTHEPVHMFNLVDLKKGE